MGKMMNIVNYLLRMAMESTDWDETEEEIHVALSKKGFNNDEIDMALNIACKIRDRLTTMQPIVIPKPSNQLFHMLEIWKLSSEARGYLIALKEQGLITELDRQAVIETALQMEVPEVDLEIVQDLVADVCDDPRIYSEDGGAYRIQ